MSGKRNVPPFITGLAISLALHASAIPLVAVWAQGSGSSRDVKASDPSLESKELLNKRADELSKRLETPATKLDPATPLPKLALEQPKPKPESPKPQPRPEPKLRKPEPANEPTEPPLGKADGTGDLRVAWISHEDFQELIAHSGTVNQPALQDRLDPIAGAPLRVQASDENAQPRVLLAQATSGQTGSSGSSASSSSSTSSSSSGERVTQSQSRSTPVQPAAKDTAPPLEVPQPKPIQVPAVPAPKALDAPKLADPKLDDPKPVPTPKLEPAPDIKPATVPEPAKITVPDPASPKDIAVPAPPAPKPLPHSKDRSTIPVPETLRTPANFSSSSSSTSTSSSSSSSNTTGNSTTVSPTPKRAADEAPILDPQPEASPAPAPAPSESTEPAESRRRSEPVKVASHQAIESPRREEVSKQAPEKRPTQTAAKSQPQLPEAKPRPTSSLENMQLARADQPTLDIDTSLRIKPLSEMDSHAPTQPQPQLTPALPQASAPAPRPVSNAAPANAASSSSSPSPAKPNIPAQPALVAGTLMPTAAARSDRQSMAVMLSDQPLNIPARNGSVKVADGIEMKTFLPQISVVTVNSSLPDNPTAKITFAPDGRVIDVKLTKSTGYADWDGPVIASFYRWRASGKRLEELGRSFEITVNLLLVK